MHVYVKNCIASTKESATITYIYVLVELLFLTPVHIAQLTKEFRQWRLPFLKVKTENDFIAELTWSLSIYLPVISQYQYPCTCIQYNAMEPML